MFTESALTTTKSSSCCSSSDSLVEDKLSDLLPLLRSTSTKLFDKGLSFKNEKIFVCYWTRRLKIVKRTQRTQFRERFQVFCTTFIQNGWRGTLRTFDDLRIFCR